MAQEAATAGTAPPDDSVADTEPIAITPLPQPTGDEIAVAILEATPTPTAQTLPESTPGGVEEAQTTQAPAEVANVVPEEAQLTEGLTAVEEAGPEETRPTEEPAVVEGVQLEGVQPTEQPAEVEDRKSVV